MPVKPYHSAMFAPTLVFFARANAWRRFLLALLGLALAACAPLKSNLTAYPPLPNDHAPGASAQVQQVANALGRGVNFGNMLEAPHEGDWGVGISTPLIQAAASGGFRTVRLPVRWSNHALPLAPFTLDAAFALRVETVVDQLLAQGFYVILNQHHYRALDGDAADAGDSPQEAGLADERFLSLWQQIAARFAKRSDHLLFELYNEPHGRLDAARWNDLAARALGVVRQSNPNRLVLISPVDWGDAAALDKLKLPNEEQLIVTVHNYHPANFTHQGAEWVKPMLPTGVPCCDDKQHAQIVAGLDLAKAWSAQNHYPIYLGEFGSYQTAAMPDRERYTRLMRQEIEKRGFSWAYWEFASGFGVYDAASKAYRTPLMQALMGRDPS